MVKRCFARVGLPGLARVPSASTAGRTPASRVVHAVNIIIESFTRVAISSGTMCLCYAGSCRGDRAGYGAGSPPAAWPVKSSRRGHRLLGRSHVTALIWWLNGLQLQVNSLRNAITRPVAARAPTLMIHEHGHRSRRGRWRRRLSPAVAVPHHHWACSCCTADRLGLVQVVVGVIV